MEFKRSIEAPVSSSQLSALSSGIHLCIPVWLNADS